MAVAPMRRHGSRPGSRCGFRRCPSRPDAKPRPAIEPGIARDLQRLVIYRDEHVLVVTKPYGMPVQGGPGISHHLDGLLDALRFGSPERPRLVHRLDRDTSGRAAVGAHAWHRGEVGSGIPRAGGGEDLLGRPGEAARSHRKAASICRCGGSAGRAGNAPRLPIATTRKPRAPSPTIARSIMRGRSLPGWNSVR